MFGVLTQLSPLLVRLRTFGTFYIPVFSFFQDFIHILQAMVFRTARLGKTGSFYLNLRVTTSSYSFLQLVPVTSTPKCGRGMLPAPVIAVEVPTTKLRGAVLSPHEPLSCPSHLLMNGTKGRKLSQPFHFKRRYSNI